VIEGDTVMKRWFSAVIGTACLVVLSPAQFAHAANSGQVMCMNREEVVGVWVEVQGGKSGWASRTGQGYAQNWHYDTQGKPYELHVGCGGSPASWRTSNSTFGFQRDWVFLNCFPEPKEQYGELGNFPPVGKCVRS
jgi:hypothetical protein